MKNNRVVITGMGMISSIGNNRKEIIKNIINCQDGLIEKEYLEGINLEKIGKKFLGEVELEINNYKYDKSYILSDFAIREAIEDSDLTKDLKKIDPYRIGMFFGTCNGNILSLEKLYRNFDSSTNFTEFIMRYCNSADVLDYYFRKKESEIFKILGPKYIFANACASSNNAFGLAFEMIKSGDIDIAFVGGADTLCETTLSGFNSFMSISQDKCSSFSKNIGLNLGESAGFCVLERLDNVIKKDKKIYAEILGYSFLGDAYKNITSLDIEAEGLAKTMEDAIFYSNLDKSNIKVICSHGTGTDANNFSESLAIKKVFLKEKIFSEEKVFSEDENHGFFVTSLKPFYGHTLGASGVTQNIIMLDCMNQGIIPPILNWKENSSNLPDSVYVKNKVLNLKYDSFISNSSAFGGNNFSIVFSKFKEDESTNNIQTNIYLNCEEKDRIVITGFSIITPFINSKEDFFSKIENNLFLDKTKKVIKYEAEKFLKEIFLKNEDIKKFAKNPNFVRFAIKNIYDLLKDKNLYEKEEIGLFFGSYKSILNFIEDYYLEILDIGMEYASALKFQNSTFNATSGHIAHIFQIKGFNSTFWGNFSPLASLGYAIEILKSKRQKMILISGSDEISKFDIKMVKESYYKDEILSEGASSIIIENYEEAIKNGNEILGEIVGFNSTSFSVDDKIASKESYLKCIDFSLNKANISKTEIDLHIFCNSVLNKELEIENIFCENTINSQKYIGLLETNSSLADIGMGIYYLNKKDSKYKKILFSCQSLNGINYSFILKKV